MFDTYFHLPYADTLHPGHCNGLQRTGAQLGEIALASRFETKDNYVGEIARRGRFWIVAGKNNLHWVIQKQRTSAKSKQGKTWSGVSYPWDRQSLVAAWKARTNLPVPDEVMALPERYSQFKQTCRIKSRELLSISCN
jgi:hypothetical protein